MNVEYTGRQVAITPALKLLAEEGLARIGKIVGETASAHVVLTAEKYRQIAEVTVTGKHNTLVALCEWPSMETALRDALAKAETQALRSKEKWRAQTRQPKEDKSVAEPELARAHHNGAGKAGDERTNGNGVRKTAAVPVVVHSPAEKRLIAEPHVLRCADCVAESPMTLEQAVKEAEFRDKDVFVFRNGEDLIHVLHRKRDGTMELIEVP